MNTGVAHQEARDAMRRLRFLSLRSVRRKAAKDAAEHLRNRAQVIELAAYELETAEVFGSAHGQLHHEIVEDLKREAKMLTELADSLGGS